MGRTGCAARRGAVRRPARDRPYNPPMTYLVLARKWRPRSFDTLVGQDHVVRALTHALATQRLHHAWLFTGTRGVGKTTLSRILAKSLNCETGITATPCGQCRACTEIDAGRFVDYLELDAASNRGVDEMTQLLEQAVYAPGAGRYKVYMIDEVHMLTGHAFNAMLKTLEEPPPHVKFILATTDPQKIPVTVLSRCLQFNLKQMPADSIVGHLQHVLGEEGIAFETPALRLIGQAASGSMRDALSLTDQAIAYSAGNLSEDAVRGMLGTIDQRHLVRLLDALAAGQGAGVLAVADELAARGLSYAGALADLAVLLSRVAVEQRVPGVTPAEDPLAGDIARLAQALHPDALQLFYSVAVHSRSELALAPDEYAGFVMACLRMLSLAGGQAGQPGVEPAPARQPAQPAPAGASAAAAAPAAASPAAAPQSAPASASAAPPQPPAAVAAQPSAGIPAARTARPSAPPESAVADAAPARSQASAQPPHLAEPAAPPALREPAPAASRPSAAAPPPADEPPPFEPDVPYDDTPDFPPDGYEPPGYAAQDFDDADYGDAPPAQGRPSPRGAAQPLLARPHPRSSEALADAGADGLRFASDAPPAAGGATAPIVLEGAWHELACSLPVTGLAGELARQSEWEGAQGRTVTLRVAARTLADSAARNRLRAALGQHFGEPVQLRIVVGETGEGTAHAVAQADRRARQEAAEAAVQADPFVRALLQDFGGAIVPGSVIPISPPQAGA